jgi:hypothetical protein
MGETVLGHVWDASNNVITFVLTVDIASKKKKFKVVHDYITRENFDKLQSIFITKRLVLSVNSSWYEPLGLLSPISTKYKFKLSEIIKENP